MANKEAERASTTGGVPVAPAISPTLASARLTEHPALVDGRVVLMTLLALLIGVASGFLAKVLLWLIAVFTNLSFFGEISWRFRSPAANGLGWWVVGVPVVGGLVVGLMARYGSQAIRGHGLPEAMESILTQQSRVPARVTFLKPLASAVAIGTGGPFGAEGPIIATGAALGSLIGQLFRTSATERKILLASGAAAGMAATFGSPVSAVLLAIELLLFEYRARSIIPVAFASATATAVHMSLIGSAPIFAMSDLVEPGGAALGSYVVIGALVGLASVYVTRLLYAAEDGFERLPLHWMWWPALGGIAVGVIGRFAPKTLGVGYDNIFQILNGHLFGWTLGVLVVLKLTSWAIALGSGSAGGTLAPLFTIGGGLGALLGAGAMAVLPSFGIDPRIAALVGMAAMFGGASRALLASVVFAFETTRQPLGLLPLLGGCSASFFISCLLMRNTIMTEKMARRGVRVLSDYMIDDLEQLLARDAATRPVATLSASQTLAEARAWLSSPAGAQHQGFPVLDEDGLLVGLVTRREVDNPRRRDDEHVSDLVERPATVICGLDSMRDAADLMARGGIGRLPVVSTDEPRRLIGILSRSDILSAHMRRLRESSRKEKSIRWPDWMRRKGAEPPTPGSDAG